MALLIVNADDYGLTDGIDRGILRGHTAGVITSTSVIALGPAFARTGSLLREHPGLGVGVHLTLVGVDPPLSSPHDIPTLVDAGGRFPRIWWRVLARALRGRIDPVDVRRELGAQIDRVRDLGVPITHLDSHQNLHLLPVVSDVVVALARERGIAAIGVPRSGGRRITGPAVSLLARGLERRIRAGALAAPTHSAGFDEAGRLDAPTLARVIERLPTSGSVLLGTHPGEADDPERQRYPWGYRWSRELDALCAPETRARLAARGFRLGTYADLRGPR